MTIPLICQIDVSGTASPTTEESKTYGMTDVFITDSMLCILTYALYPYRGGAGISYAYISNLTGGIAGD